MALSQAAAHYKQCGDISLLMSHLNASEAPSQVDNKQTQDFTRQASGQDLEVRLALQAGMMKKMMNSWCTSLCMSLCRPVIPLILLTLKGQFLLLIGSANS